MNIVLFEMGEAEAGYLPNEDERVEHIRKVLRRHVGDTFDAGVIHGKKGKATVLEYGERTMSFEFQGRQEEPKLLPIDLVVGLSRPQTMRKILNEATTLGVRSIRFVVTDRGEPSYAESKLWSTGEWRRHVVAGAAQAFTTRLPLVTWGQTLEEALEAVGEHETRLSLDNYEGVMRLGEAVVRAESKKRTTQGESPEKSVEGVALAIGAERGWTTKERDRFRERGWTLVGMGERVLRTETAVVAAVSVVRELVN